MQTKIEGLILSKIPYQERHVLAKFLLRNGHMANILLYGGRGGGKHQKGSDLEIGHLCSGVVQVKQSVGGLLGGKEFISTWRHKNIRSSHRAYALLCFFLEVIAKLAPEAHFEKMSGHEHEISESTGLFKVLSNAQVYLDQSLERKQEPLLVKAQLTLFISKLMLELGIFPLLEKCVLSGQKINNTDDLALLTEQGGFAELPLVNSDMRLQKANLLWRFLVSVREKRYSEMVLKEEDESFLHRLILDYFFYHTNLHPLDFKTLSLVL